MSREEKNIIEGQQPAPNTINNSGVTETNPGVQSMASSNNQQDL